MQTIALEKARATLAASGGDAQVHRSIIGGVEHPLRAPDARNRRLIGRSDRAEREMDTLNVQLQTLAQQLEHRATHDALTGI